MGFAATTPTVFEVERFEWNAGGNLEVAGRWTGVGARRFVRPSLELVGGDERRRLLADLEHKPWAPEEGDEWVATFPWHGEPIVYKAAVLTVAPGIEVKLPAPYVRSSNGEKGKRFPHRAVARDSVSLDGDEATGEEVPPRLQRALDREKDAGKALLAEATAQRARAERERDEALAKLRERDGETEPATRPAEATAPEATAASLAAAMKERDDARSERAGALAARDVAQGERDRAYAAREEAERERDQMRAARDAFAAERDKALAERDQAIAERDQAVRDFDRALDERDKALADADKAFRKRDQAFAERDHAVAERDKAVAERDSAFQKRLSELQAWAGPAESQAAIWTGRAVALGLLVVFACIVYVLAHGT